jgi:hypothetical protein
MSAVRTNQEITIAEAGSSRDIYQIGSVGQLALNLTSGLDRIPSRLDGVVASFLENYVGAPGRPVPFGGRDADLDSLDAWLDGDHGRPYALLSARGGVGKSALLAHWALRVSQRSDVHVVYFPISVRFGTASEVAVFSALAARLAELLGERPVQSYDAVQCRGAVADLLRRPPSDGKRLLVVLDGLDEAQGWEPNASLTPSAPPSHLRVLGAARPYGDDPDRRQWLLRLNWALTGTLLSLRGLDTAGVRDVLRKMGDPLEKLSPRTDVVSKLIHLTRGDPLLIGLYVEQLQTFVDHPETFDPAQLDRLDPGLHGVFTLWWDFQIKLWGTDAPLREARVRALLRICSLALGPIMPSDIASLVPDTLPDTITVDSAARDLRRFLVKSRGGLSFTHPNLSEHVAQALSLAERRAWEKKFIDYGDQVLRELATGAVEPEQASAYAVRYYSLHLDRGGQLAERYHQIISVPWCRAWQALEGTPGGFWADVNRVVRSSSGKRHSLHARVRSCFFLCSIGTASRQIPLLFFIQLLDSRILTFQQGFAVACQQFSDNRPLYILGCLTVANEASFEELWRLTLKEAGRVNKRTLRGRLAWMNEEKPPEEEEALRGLLSRSVTKIRDVGLAAQASKFIENVFARRPLPDAEKGARIQAGSWRQWMSLAAKLEVTKRAEGLRRLHADLATPQGSWVRPWLMSIIKGYEDPLEREAHLIDAMDQIAGLRNSELRALAVRAAVLHLSPPTDGLLRRAFDIARGIENEPNRSRCLESVIRKAGRLDPSFLREALTAAECIEDNFAKSRVLRAVAATAHVMERPRVLGMAFEATNLIGGAVPIITLVGLVSSKLPDPQRRSLLNRATTVADSFGESQPRARANCFANLVRWLDGNRKETVCNEVLELAKRLPNRSSQALLLGRLTENIGSISPGVAHSVLSAAANLADLRSRTVVSLRLMECVHKVDNEVPKQILGVIERLESTHLKEIALVDFARRIHLDRSELVEACLSTAGRTRNDWVVAAVIEAVMPRLGVADGALRARLMQSVCTIRNRGAKLVALCAMAGTTVGDERARLRAEALGLTNCAQLDWPRFRCSLALASLADGAERGFLLNSALNTALQIAKPHLRHFAFEKLMAQLTTGDEAFTRAMAEAALSKAEGLGNMLTMIASRLTVQDDLAEAIMERLLRGGFGLGSTRVLGAVAKAFPRVVSGRLSELVSHYSRDHRPLLVHAFIALAPAIEARDEPDLLFEVAEVALETVLAWR